MRPESVDRMRALPRPVSGLLSTALALALAGCGARDRPGSGTFAGHWSGHTRSLDITRSGEGREFADDGCCRRVITVRFRVLRVDGTRDDGDVRVEITSARVDASVLRTLHRHALRAGQVGTLRIRRGVLADLSTGLTYCAPNVGKCGA